MDYRVLVVFVYFGFGFASCTHLIVREYRYVNLPMTWADARQYCREKHADLATFESMDDINRLQPSSAYALPAWIGLNDDPLSWKGVMTQAENSWRWSSTGTTSSNAYNRLNLLLPNFFAAKEFCVEVWMAGEWNDLPCGEKRYFICYSAPAPTAKKTYILLTNALTWWDAQAYCREHYTDLATISSDDENADFMSVKGGHLVWIGLYRIPWTWSDNSNVSFTNWMSGRPDNFFGVQHCVAHKDGHLWDDENCDDKHPFFCNEAKKVKVTFVLMKIQSDADLSDPATQLLQQLGEALGRGGITDFQVRWKTQPRKLEEDKR